MQIASGNQAKEGLAYLLLAHLLAQAASALRSCCRAECHRHGSENICGLGWVRIGSGSAHRRCHHPLLAEEWMSSLWVLAGTPSRHLPRSRGGIEGSELAEYVCINAERIACFQSTLHASDESCPHLLEAKWGGSAQHRLCLARSPVHLAGTSTGREGPKGRALISLPPLL